MRCVVGRLGSVRAGVAALALVAALVPARAEDGGFFGFLSSALGVSGAPAPAASPAPAPSEGEQVRPLTVRRAPHKAARAKAGAGRAHFARLPGKTGPVSIYEDPTLRSGDAVMTKDGMRVFAGGRFSPEHPYAASDFIAVTDAKSVSPTVKKAITDLNKLPHG